jgi:hypothetical protein
LISRLVTVDLVLTTCERLRQLPEYNGLDPKQLYDQAISILKDWAHDIETRSLTVSLDAIVENAFWKLPQTGPRADALLDIGKQLIDSAGDYQFFLSGDRSVQPYQTAFRQELEAALKDTVTVEWFIAAKEITMLKNSTDASAALRACLAWLPDYVLAAGDSFLRQELNQFLGGKKHHIPKAFVTRLRETYYPAYKNIKKALS